MAKFKKGDRVRRIGKNLVLGSHTVNVGDEGTVEKLNGKGWVRVLWDLPECSAGSMEDRLELVPSKDPAIPLRFVLDLDRQISKAGGSADVLPDYLDKPLSDFILNVMIPNSLSVTYTGPASDY